MTVPLVSIALPVYNGEEWLDLAIGTLTKQSYENIEIIVADDCSTDNSPKICEHYVSRFPQIRFIKNDTNLGALGNFQKILNLCSGKYIAYASQDDYWDRNFISYLVEKLEANRNAVLAGSAVQMIDKKGKNYKIRRYNGKWNPEKLSTPRLIYALMLPVKFKGKRIKNNLFFHGVLHTDTLKYCFRIFPGIIEHDRHFLLLLALSGKWCYDDRVLYFRRVGDGSHLRKMSNDPIHRRKMNIFRHVINLLQMIIGAIKHRNASISIKLFCMPIIVAHVVWDVFKPFKVLADKAVKNLMHQNSVVSLRERVDKKFS